MIKSVVYMRSIYCTHCAGECVCAREGYSLLADIYSIERGKREKRENL